MKGIVKRVFSSALFMRLVRRDRARGQIDPKYYRATYPDVARAGVDPFHHFMAHGWREGRNPSAHFNTLFYRDRHLDGAEVNPITHYLEVGRTAGLAPRPASGEEFLQVQRPLVAPFFEPQYYQMQTGRLSEDPLTHYLSTGWRQGTSPSSQFDPKIYSAQHVFLEGLAVSPLYHFASQRRLRTEGTRPPATPKPIEISTQRVRALIEPEFDPAYYRRMNPDVAKANFDPVSHYIDHGWREGRNPQPLFDGGYYLSRNKDVAGDGLNPFYHYLAKGRAEGRRGNPIGTRLYPPLEAPEPDAWAEIAPQVSVNDAEYVVIMPVYKGYDETLAAVYAVLTAPQRTPFALHVIDDVSPDDGLSAILSELAIRGLLSYSKNESNLGFVKSVNRGLRRFATKEVVLLNSDAQVFGDWLDRIDRHARSDPSIATITPLSNNATICSYPLSNGNNVVEPECSAAELDEMASTCNAGRISDIPTGVGFCFYMSRASREAVGILDEASFGRGYGEENDYCLRAAKAGFRNVLAEDIFVYHAGEVSFAAFVAEEYGAGQAALLSKHPDYPLRIQQFLKADSSEYGRMRLDLLRLARDAGPSAMVFVSHALTGGIETHTARMEAALRADGVTVVHVKVGVVDRWSLAISSGSLTAPYCPNLRPTAFNQIRPLLAEFLGWLKPTGIHIHSLVGLDWTATGGLLDLVRDTRIPYFFTLHDYSVVCHRNDLVKPDGRYCRLPAVDVCAACVASDRSYPEALDPRVRRQTYDAFLHGAAAVFAPSHDIAARLERAGAIYRILVRPHEEVNAAVAPVERPSADTTTLDIVTIGAVGAHKGSRVILSLARDAKARALPIRFHIIGYSDLTEEMRAAGVTETGRYSKDEEAFDHIREIRPACIFLPSIWPETFCYALSMAFDLEVPPVVFDLGAQRDRMRDAAFGFVLPYALIEDVKALNDRLMALPFEDMAKRGRPRPIPCRDVLADYYELSGSSGGRDRRPAACP